jgi:hypothetical protein
MGAFFPLSFSAVLAAVVLAASKPLPPFPAISSSAPVGFRTRTRRKTLHGGPNPARRAPNQSRSGRESGGSRARNSGGIEIRMGLAGEPLPFSLLLTRRDRERDFFSLDCGERLLVWWGFYKGRELTV